MALSRRFSSSSSATLSLDIEAPMLRWRFAFFDLYNSCQICQTKTDTLSGVMPMRTGSYSFVPRKDYLGVPAAEALPRRLRSDGPQGFHRRIGDAVQEDAGHRSGFCARSR